MCGACVYGILLVLSCNPLVLNVYFFISPLTPESARNQKEQIPSQVSVACYGGELLWHLRHYALLIL